MDIGNFSEHFFFLFSSERPLLKERSWRSQWTKPNPSSSSKWEEVWCSCTWDEIGNGALSARPVKKMVAVNVWVCVHCQLFITKKRVGAVRNYRYLRIIENVSFLLNPPPPSPKNEHVCIYTGPIFSGDEIRTHLCMHSLQWLVSVLVSIACSQNTCTANVKIIMVHTCTVIHFYFGSVQFSVKRKFAVSVRRKFRWRLAMGWAGPTATGCFQNLGKDLI